MRDDGISADLEEVKKAEARQKNPHLKEYHNKLKELLQSEVSARDNFINWVTGLSGGAFLFVFAKIEKMADNEKVLLWAGATLFLAVISAMFFKMFLRVYYGPLRLDVKLLRILWEDYELRRDANEEKAQNGGVCRKTIESLERSRKESIKVLDPKHKKSTEWWSIVGSTLLSFFYWSTIVLFISGFICIGAAFLFKAYKIAV